MIFVILIHDRELIYKSILYYDHKHPLTKWHSSKTHHDKFFSHSQKHKKNCQFIVQLTFNYISHFHMLFNGAQIDLQMGFVHNTHVCNASL